MHLATGQAPVSCGIPPPDNDDATGGASRLVNADCLRPAPRRAISRGTKSIMADWQAQYDDAMFDFSTGDYDSAVAKLSAIVAADPAQFDAQLALGMAYYRKGDFARAIIEGHKAEKLQPGEQLVHTNLSLFYMKSGDKKTAEHHGLQARIASWSCYMSAPAPGAESVSDPELELAKPKPQNIKLPEKFPDMPWKKNAKNTTAPSTPPNKPAEHTPPPPTEPAP